jgi:hypothetical protein
MSNRGVKAEPIVLIPKQILVEAKRCLSCGQYKELKDYGKELRTQNGLKGTCKSCEANKKKRI